MPQTSSKFIHEHRQVHGVLWPGCSLVGGLRPRCALQQRVEGGSGAYIGPWGSGLCDLGQT